jgi:hypothetical protein
LSSDFDLGAEAIGCAGSFREARRTDIGRAVDKSLSHDIDPRHARARPAALRTAEPLLDIVLVVAVFAALLVLVALSQPLAARLRLAPVVLLAVVGVSISAASGALLQMPLTHSFGGIERLFADLPLGSETFIYVFLPLLIFEAALASDVRRILEDAAPILALAVIATLVAAGIVGVALWPFAGLSLAVERAEGRPKADGTSYFARTRGGNSNGDPTAEWSTYGGPSMLRARFSTCWSNPSETSRSGAGVGSQCLHSSTRPAATRLDATGLRPA